MTETDLNRESKASLFFQHAWLIILKLIIFGSVVLLMLLFIILGRGPVNFSEILSALPVFVGCLAFALGINLLYTILGERVQHKRNELVTKTGQ